jgi:hypothetical protein
LIQVLFFLLCEGSWLDLIERNIRSKTCHPISINLLKRRFGWLNCLQKLLSILNLWFTHWFYSQWLLWRLFISVFLMKLTQFVSFLVSISSSNAGKFWYILIMFIMHHESRIFLDFIVIRLIHLIMRFFKWAFIYYIIMQFLFRFLKFIWRRLVIVLYLLLFFIIFFFLFQTIHKIVMKILPMSIRQSGLASFLLFVRIVDPIIFSRVKCRNRRLALLTINLRCRLHHQHVDLRVGLQTRFYHFFVFHLQKCLV